MTNKIEKNANSKRSLRNQYYAIFAGNIIMLSQGFIVGWFTPALPVLTSDHSPLESGPLTTQEVSWVGSINSMGAFVGAITGGLAANWIGAKRTLLFLAIPAVIFWLTIIFQTSVTYFLCARFLCGWIYTGLDSNMLLFIAEIADDSIRGKVGSMTPLIRSFGMWLAYIVGAYVEYSIIPYLYICFPIIFFAIFTFLPNTPQYLIRNGEFEDAKKSLIFYRGYKKDDANDLREAETELERLKSMTSATGKVESVGVKDLCHPVVLKGIGIGIVLTCMHQLNGNITILSYAVMIFEASGSSIDANTSSIILGFFLLTGIFFATAYSDTIGRKILLIMSLLGCVVGNAAMATYLYLENHGVDVSHYGFVPVVSLSCVIFCSSFGIVPLALICVVESLPTKVRTFGLTVCSFNLHFTSFYTTKLFPILSETIYLYGCMSIFAVASLVGLLFVTFVLKETKGKNLDTI